MKKNTVETANIEQVTGNTLNKENVLKRLKSTKLSEVIEDFQVKTWVPGDAGLPIKWKSYQTSLGEIVIASTEKGVCFLGFGDDKREMSLKELHEKFPDNNLEEGGSKAQQDAVDRIEHPDGGHKVQLHLRGTAFQLKVWEKILKVPFGGLITYGQLGEQAGDARAVGSAVGANPVCLIIGCHRVVHSDGNIEGFHYGTPVKEKLLAYEASHSGTV